jgi:hypothetical protein
LSNELFTKGSKRIIKAVQHPWRNVSHSSMLYRNQRDKLNALWPTIPYVYHKVLRVLSSKESPCHGLPRVSLFGKSSVVKYFHTLLWCHRLPYFSNIEKQKKDVIRNVQMDTTNMRKQNFSGILIMTFWIKWKFKTDLHNSISSTEIPVNKYRTENSAGNHQVPEDYSNHLCQMTMCLIQI